MSGYLSYRLRAQTVNITRENSLAAVNVQRYNCRIATCVIRPKNWFICPKNWCDERWEAWAVVFFVILSSAMINRSILAVLVTRVCRNVTIWRAETSCVNCRIRSMLYCPVWMILLYKNPIEGLVRLLRPRFMANGMTCFEITHMVSFVLIYNRTYSMKLNILILKWLIWPNNLVSMSKLVQDKEFDDLSFYKLLFSVGGGSYSTREGALFNVIKVNRPKMILLCILIGSNSDF